MKTPTRNVALDRSIEADLVLVAAEEERSVSWVVRQACRMWFDARRQKAPSQRKREESPA
jgi:hypothetical protein